MKIKSLRGKVRSAFNPHEHPAAQAPERGSDWGDGGVCLAHSVLPTGSWTQKSTGQNRPPSALFMPSVAADARRWAQGSAPSVGRQVGGPVGRAGGALLCPELQQGPVRGLQSAPPAPTA